MRIDEILSSGDEPVFSFEFFPPKTPEGEANLYAAIEQLRPLEPAYVSVTYGAGGSTRGKTLEIVSRIRDELRARGDGALHLRRRDRRRAARDARRDARARLRQRARAARRPAGGAGAMDEDRGRPRVLARARRADPRRLRLRDRRRRASPRRTSTRPAPRTTCATSRRRSTPASTSSSRSCSSTTPTTSSSSSRARAVGIDVPIIPGIMPITNVAAARADRRAVRRRDPRRPARASSRLRARRRRGGRSSSASPTRRCSAPSCWPAARPGIHFYTLNRSPATRAILSALKLLRPWERGSRRVPRRSRLFLDGLDLEPLGHRRRPVGARPSGRRPSRSGGRCRRPRRRGPAPAADLVLAQLLLEHERAA